MDTFTDLNGHPITSVNLAVGETKIVSLKKFALTPMVEVAVMARNSKIAISHQCVHLGDMSKKSYNDVYDMAEVSKGNVPIESHGRYYFQLCGISAGTTMLEAFYWVSKQGRMGVEHAPAITVNVKANAKLLVPPPAPGTSVGNFETMWRNHPMNPSNGAIHYPCNEGKPPLGHMQCFVRLCEALYLSGVSFKNCWGSKCQLHGTEHHHHFSNPYDFPTWSWAKTHSYVWEAKPPYAPEPMPGLAAFDFVKGRQGIILFTNYFSIKGQTSMWGGHIDLWNKDRMGNTYKDIDPSRGESAFLRSRKISFFPLVADADHT